MPFKYGDAVVLIQKSPDGTLSRVNALVVASVTQPKDANPRTGLRGHKGLLPEGEYLDLLFPRTFPDGHIMKSRHPEDLLKPAAMVSAWKDGSWIGWQPGSVTEVAPTPAPISLPSEADLDAVEEEVKTKEKTSNIRVVKGK